MADLLQNIAKIYLRSDRTEKLKINPFIGRGGNGSYAVMLVAPFEASNSQYINFGFENKIPIDPRYMTLVGTENSDNTDNETWNVWFYEVKGKILAGAANEVAAILKTTFSEFVNSTTPSQYTFIGFQSSEAELDVNFPTPDDDDYAGVGSGTTIGTSTCYLATSGVWVNQNKTVRQFESDNGILRETLNGESPIVELTVDPNISTVTEDEDNTNLDVIFKNISLLNSAVLDMQTLLGTDGENFVKSDLLNSYAEGSSPDSDDVLYYQEFATGDPKRVTVATLLESGRAIFVGTFETASGLTCPDPEDLLCTYPNGILDPSDRRGWIANVNSTSTVWAWSEVTNLWVDTNQAQADMSNSFYDSTNDPKSNANNGQDMGVDHGVAIKVNDDKILVVENKTQNFNEDGDIKENIKVLTNKDIDSVDINTSTAGTYQKIIQAIIGEYSRTNANASNISINAGNIADRLIKDFSALPSIALEGEDLLVAQDDTDGLNKKFSITELATKIEGLISNDQGWYTNMAALEAAIPVGEDGWFATLGDTDTMGIWDSDTTDWVEVASKLYYTLAAGIVLEGRVTAAELAITANANAILLKFDIANLTDDVETNNARSDLATTPKGVYDYVNPQIQVFQEVRIYNKAVQVDTVISRASTDTTLFDGRIDRVEIEAGIVQNPGLATYSIDGGTTLKNIAVYDVGSGQYVNLDLGLSIVAGTYFGLVFCVILDKWLVIDSDVDVALIRGANWLPVMTTAGNYALISSLTIRVSNLEVNQGVTAYQDIRQNNVVEVLTNGTAPKLPLDTIKTESNETDILDASGFDHVIKVNTEPGIEISFYSQIKNTGTLNSFAQITFHIADESNPAVAGSFIVGQKYIVNTVGTTDFTAIGASSNAVGIVFIATGIGTGTGTALTIFRDVVIGADGENTENDRGIDIPISNNDYVAPFTPSVYYTLDSSTADILQTIVAVKTLFPSGNAAASTLTTVLIDSATETRNGVGTIQKDHNDESVVDRKNLIESGLVVVANYQSAGQYLANKPNIILDTNKIVRVLFSGSGTDLTELVELSLGGTYYDVEYRETTVDLTVKNAVTHVMDLYFTGTKFIATYVDSAIENVDLPYIKAAGQFSIPKNEVPVVIGAKNTQKLINMYGSPALAQIIPNGNFITAQLDFSGNGNTSVAIVNNELVMTSTVDGNFDVTYDISNTVSIGDKLLIKFKVKSNTVKTGGIRDLAGTSFTQVTWTNTAEYQEISFIATMAATTFLFDLFLSGAVAGETMTIDDLMVIPLPASITTVAGAEAVLDGKYFENLNWVGKERTYDQLLDNRNSFSAWSVTQGAPVFESDEIVFSRQLTNDIALSNEGVFENNKSYTVLGWCSKNTSSEQTINVGDTGRNIDNVIAFAPGEIGVFKTLSSTGTITDSDFRVYTTGSSAETGEARVKFVVIEGDLTNITDEEALRIIKDVDYGEFSVIGTFVSTEGKNKFDKSQVIEGGYYNKDTGAWVVNAAFTSTNFVSVLENEDFIASPTVAFGSQTAYWDRDKNYISGETTSDSLNVPSNAYYVTMAIDLVDLVANNLTYDDIQIELGTVPTAWEKYIKQITHVKGELFGVPTGVVDDLEYQRISNEIIYDGTEGWDSFTIIGSIYRVRITRPVDMLGTDGTIVAVLENELVNNSGSTELTSIWAPTHLFLGILQTTIDAYSGKGAGLSVLSDLLSYLGDNNITLHYELETYLPRTEANNNEIPVYGQVLVDIGGTYSQESNGVIGEFIATTSVNTKSQTNLNTEAIVKLVKEVFGNQIDTESIEVKLNKVIADVGYLPSLTTTNKLDLVAAINEVVATTLKLDGSAAMTANLNMATHKIINLVDPTLPQDAATMVWVENQISALVSNLNWKESVATFADIATTYPAPDDGWTVNVEDDDLTYRYDGATWIKISANSIPKATSIVDGLMSKEDKARLDDIGTLLLFTKTDGQTFDFSDFVDYDEILFEVYYERVTVDEAAGATPITYYETLTGVKITASEFVYRTENFPTPSACTGFPEHDNDETACGLAGGVWIPASSVTHVFRKSVTVPVSGLPGNGVPVASENTSHCRCFPISATIAQVELQAITNFAPAMKVYGIKIN